MTELDWLNSTHVYKMLLSLKGRESERKMRLFVAACCRRVWHRLPDSRSRQAIDIAEQYADGKCTSRERREAHKQAKAAMLESDKGASGDTAWALRGELVALAVADWLSASLLAWLFNESELHRNPTGEPSESKFQADLLRELIGNPFLLMAFQASWKTATVTTLACQMYESRDFGPMPILADALEDAGCDNADILNHCRTPGQHVRGCWVVDLILGKQ